MEKAEMKRLATRGCQIHQTHAWLSYLREGAYSNVREMFWKDQTQASFDRRSANKNPRPGFDLTVSGFVNFLLFYNIFKS
jgi:hypothetical protein